MIVPIDQIKYKMFQNRKSFRRWLEVHHAKETELWIGFFKKGTDKSELSNSDAVEEALCFGWINGKVRRLDDDIYLQRFSPRHDRSVWSDSNKARVKKLIKQGLMTEYGLAKIRAAKENGSWQSVDIDIDTIPSDLQHEFSKNKKALENFQHFTDSQRRTYLWWIADAKHSETREKRIQEVILRSLKKIKPGNPVD